MKVAITKLRRKGMRLRHVELESAIDGELSMYDWPTANSFGRPMRCMEVKVPVGSLMQAKAVLFDPELIAVVDGHLVFRGIELDTLDDRVYEHEQIWRVLVVGGLAPGHGS